MKTLIFKNQAYMNLYEFFSIIMKRWKLVVFTMTIPIILSIIICFFIVKPVYKSDTSILIGIPENSETKPYTYNDLLMYQNMVKYYEEIAKSRIVLQNALAALKLPLNLNDIKQNTLITSIEGTEILVITVQSQDPNEAAKIANQLVQSLKLISTELKGTDNVRIIDEAIPVNQPISPNKKLYVFIGFFLGLILSVSIVILLEYIDANRKHNIFH